jgi:hypothetical protein
LLEGSRGPARSLADDEVGEELDHMQAAKMTPGGNAKMAISATQLTLFFSISSLFFSTPPDKFFPDFASTFH